MSKTHTLLVAIAALVLGSIATALIVRYRDFRAKSTMETIATAAEAIGTVDALIELQKGNTNRAIEILEQKLDAEIRVLHIDMNSSPGPQKAARAMSDAAIASAAHYWSLYSPERIGPR